MARRNSYSSTPEQERLLHSQSIAHGQQGDFEIIDELARLQELVISETQIPLTRWKLIHEDKLLDQIEMIENSLPQSLRKAQAILEEKDVIISEAEDYAKRIIQSAQQRAAQILDETGIIQQAQQQAAQIRQQVQQECEAAQEKTIAEIEQMRRVATQELQQYRQQIMAECDHIQDGAADYADSMLTRLEQQLTEMLSIVRHGRAQIGHKQQPVNGGVQKGR